MKVKPEELAPLADFINNSYVGDLASASNDLSKAVFMLHHVKKDEVRESELHDVCFALHHISQGLFDAYLHQKSCC